MPNFYFLNKTFLDKPYHLGQIFMVPLLILGVVPFFIISFFINILNLSLTLYLSLDNLNSSYFKNYQFTSNMVKTEDLTKGFYRLLATDNNVILPYGSWIRFLITSMDVIHSWTVPSLGIKLDACPGRLNQTAVFLKREGFFYGQCSEICGVNHAFMPIVIEAVDLESFYVWCKSPFESFFKVD